MPSMLCKSEKQKLNQLIDQVNNLSDIVDELRAEVDLLKIRSITTSNDSITKRRGRSKDSAFFKLKRCLEKSSPLGFLKVPANKVRRTYQEIFSQIPTTNSPSDNLSHKKPQINQNFQPSYGERNRYSDKIRTKGKENGQPSIRREKIHIGTQNSESFQRPPSNCVKYSAIEPDSIYKTYDSLRSPRGKFDSHDVKKKATERKNVNTVKLIPASTFSTPAKRIEEPESLQHKRSVTFVDRNRKIPYEQSSSANSLISSSSTSEHQLEKIDKIVYPKPIIDFRLQESINRPSDHSKAKTRSSSAQCSTDYKYLKKPPFNIKEASTDTSPNNFSQKSKDKKRENSKVVRQKLSATHETQTTAESNDYKQEMYFPEKSRHYPKSKKSCSPVASLSSLTSCSLSSLSSFCLKSKEPSEDVKENYHKQKLNSEKGKMNKYNRKAEVSDYETHSENKTKQFPLRDAKKGINKGRNFKLKRNRKKRTYIISSDASAKKVDGAVQSNFYEKEKDAFSSRSTKLQDQLKDKTKLKWKEPYVYKEDLDDQSFFDKQSFPRQDDEYLSTSVCTNQRRKSFLPNLERSKNRMGPKIQNKHRKLSKVHKETSISSHESTDETCSLTSDSSFAISEKTCCGEFY